MKIFCGHDTPFSPVSPEVYSNSSAMAEQALKIKNEEGRAFCHIPFCCTVEAEAFGAEVNYGDNLSVPRVSGHKYNSFDEIDLAPIDFTRGRIHEVIAACKIIHDMNEKVCVEVSGPMSILNGLLDFAKVFKSWRKDRDKVRDVMKFIADELLKYMTNLKEAGADIISFADPSGSEDILGPKFSGYMAEDFIIPFMKSAVALADKNTLLHLCPRNSYMLVNLGRAEWLDHYSGIISYDSACIASIGKIKLTGHLCIKARNYILTDGIIKEIHIASDLV